jgi:hypothetical protein
MNNTRRYGVGEMRRTISVAVSLYLIIGILSPCYGDDYKKLGTAGFKFLDIDPGARSSAMGGASNSICSDASALFQNPAGLALISNSDVMFSQNTWIADISQYAVGLAINANRIGLGWLGGVFGFSLLYTDNGDMIRTEYLSGYDDFYQHEEPYTIDEWALGIAYARNITDRFAFGGHVKYAVQDLGTTTIWHQFEYVTDTVRSKLAPVVLDFGTVYNTGFRDLRLSMSFRNFSPEIIYVRDKFELPITMRIGIAMDVLSLVLPQDAPQSFTVALDAVHPRDYTERIHLGCEYQFRGLAIRFGNKFNYDEEGFSAGIGLNQKIGNSKVRFDYAYTSFGVFDSVNRITFGISF